MVATGLCLLRLHQRKGLLAGAGLAGTVRGVRLPAEAGGCQARFPGRAGSLTGAVLPRPPRRLCLQRHDTARDKVIFACGPRRPVAPQRMRPQSPADRRIWPVPCRGAPPRARICEPAGAPQAMRPVPEKTSAGQAPEPAVPRRPAATNPPIDPQRIIDPARGATVLTSRAVVRAAQRLISDIRR